MTTAPNTQGSLSAIWTIHPDGTGIYEAYSGTTRITDDDQKFLFSYTDGLLSLTWTEQYEDYYGWKSYNAWPSRVTNTVQTALMTDSALYRETFRRVGTGTGIQGAWRSVTTWNTNGSWHTTSEAVITLAGGLGVLTNLNTYPAFPTTETIGGISNITAHGDSYELVFCIPAFGFWYTNYYRLIEPFLVQTNTASVLFKQ